MATCTWKRLLFFLLSVLALFLFFAPTLISTGFGQRLSLSLLSHFSSLSIDIESFSLSWTEGIEAEQIVIKDDRDQTLFTCKKCSVQRPLYRLLFAPSNVGVVEVQSPTVYIHETCKREKTGKSREKRREIPSVGADEDEDADQSDEKEWSWPTGKFKIFDGRLIALREDTVVQELSGLNITLELHHNRSLGSIEIASLRQGTLSFSLYGRRALNQLDGSIKLKVEKIKTEIIEILLEQFFPDIAHLPKECFGSWVTCSLETIFDGGVISGSSALSSENIQSNFSWELQDRVLTFKKGEWFKGTVSPELFAFLPIQRLSPSTLLHPAEVVFENGVPFSFDLKTCQLLSPIDLNCTIEPFSLLFERSQRTVDFSLNGSMYGQGDSARGQLSLKAHSQKESGRMELTVQMEKQEKNRFLNGDLRIEGEWPLIAEAVSNLSFSKVIGPTISGSVIATGTCSEFFGPSLQGQVRITSPKIEHSAAFSWAGKELLFKKSSLNWTIPSSFLGLKPLTKDLNVHMIAQDIAIPLKIFQEKERRLDVSGSLSVTVDFPSFSFGNKALLLEETTAIIELEKKPGSRSCDLLLRSSLLPKVQKHPLRSGPFGQEEMKVLLEGRYDLISRIIAIDRFDIAAKHFFVNIYEVIVDTRAKKCTLQTPSHLSIRIDKDLFSFLLPPTTPLSLQSPAEITCVVPPCWFSYKNGSLSGSNINVEIASEKIQLAAKEAQQAFRVRIPLSLDFNTREISSSPVLVDTTTQRTLLKGSCSLTIPEQVKDFGSYTAQGSAKISQLPLSLADTLFSFSPRKFLGEAVSAKIDFSFTGWKESFFKIKLSSSVTSFDCHFALDQMVLKAVEPLFFSTSLSPSLVADLSSKLKMSPPPLLKPVAVRSFIENCEVDLSNLTKKRSIWKALESALFSAKLSTSAIHLKEVEPIPECKAHVDLRGPDHFIGFSAHLPPHFNLQGSLEKCWNNTGISLSDSTLNLTAKLKKSPTTMITSFFPGNKEAFNALIGQNIEMNLTTSIEKMKTGFFNGDLFFSNGTLHFESAIKDGTLTLKNPATLQIKLDRKAGKELMKGSWLASALRSQEPIQLTIDSEGVMIPLSPFSVSRMALPRITVDPGKLVVKNKGALTAILSLLNMKNAAREERVELWFTPVYMELRNGIIICRRFDLLAANKLHIITWGNLHLNEDRVDMIAAVPQETLRELKLPMVLLSPERGLQIPITGPIFNPSVDTARLSTRLAASKIQTKKKKNPLNLLGGALQVAAALGEEGLPVPAPTTQPFPWENP